MTSKFPLDISQFPESFILNKIAEKQYKDEYRAAERVCSYLEDLASGGLDPVFYYAPWEAELDW